MTRILVKCQSDNEWAFIELQGVLSARSNTTGGLEKSYSCLRGQSMGKMSINPLGKPELVIGNRLLEGKVVKLSKPWVVTKKVAESLTKRIKTTESSDTSSSSETATQIDVVGIVRQKYVFDTMPQPIVTV
mmetsp:Transcript_21467/g.42618  ORF Transcript_21467/g.42618 Transcript_21467/m.42618 type:complete len:131 (-) Transcript_21467:191-583(-)